MKGIGRALLCAGLLTRVEPVAAAAPLQLAVGVAPDRSSSAAADVKAEWWQLDTDGRVQEKRPLSPDLVTPLGSLWKLFVYDFLVSNAVPEKPYVCRGQSRDEVYCCEPGQQIARDDALSKSCGLYFAPERFAITQTVWGDYWSATKAPAWLHDLDRVQAATEVSVQSLLNVLATLPAQAKARQVLLDRALQPVGGEGATIAGASAPLAATLGARLRVKTWSWHESHDANRRIGGFAGWLADGTPLWASGPGTSYSLLSRYGAALDKALPAAVTRDPQPCVEIRLFDRYPIQSLETLTGAPVLASGALSGEYRVRFANGNAISVTGENDLFWMTPATAATAPVATPPQLVARLSREEYVARVLDREAAAEPPEAAKALAVVARTYLQQNAARAGECLQISDSSQHQRVAPRPATGKSRAIAHWTDSLILAGAPVTYHQTESGLNRLSWQRAQQQAVEGWRYDAILATAFPRSNLARWDNPRVTCESLPEAEQWLQKQISGWRPILDLQPGYQEQHQFAICRLQAGNPHVDRQRRQIHVRALRTQQDRLDLAHEYLHLAFEAHPAGQDENFIEALTRRLLLEQNHE